MRLKTGEKLALAATILCLAATICFHACDLRQTGDFSMEERLLTAEEPGEGKININTATAEELEQLYGIGPTLAGEIIAYREENGAFRRIEDITRVSGIGPELYSGICEMISTGN